jgi:hypothetical protein
VNPYQKKERLGIDLRALSSYALEKGRCRQMTTEEYLKARKSKDWKFNRIVDSSSFRNVNRIHPIKQKIVKEIVDEAKKDYEVERIIIFT